MPAQAKLTELLTEIANLREEVRATSTAMQAHSRVCADVQLKFMAIEERISSISQDALAISRGMQ